VGIHGTFGDAVIRRRHEIGVRLALGAQRSQIVWHFLRDAAVVVSAGLAIGVAAARGASRWMQSLLFGLDARDVETTVLACAGVVMVTAMATFVPARRAALTDPATTLRE
jgi:ABC-type lipoprotein release transport system permease subunit